MTARPDAPDWYDVVQALLEEQRLELHTAFPARVQRYYPADQTADLVPLVRHPVPQPDGSVTYEDLPVLPRVPLLFQRTASWFLSLPVAAGDSVLVVCQEAAAEHWRAGDGAAQYPGDLRRHHLAHAVAIPGLFPARRALSHASATDLVIGSDADDGARVAFRPDGDFVVNNGTLKVARVTDPVRVGTLTGANGGGPVNFVFQPLDANGAPSGPPVTGPTALLSAIISAAGGALHFRG